MKLLSICVATVSDDDKEQEDKSEDYQQQIIVLTDNDAPRKRTNQFVRVIHVKNIAIEKTDLNQNSISFWSYSNFNKNDSINCVKDEK